MPKPTQALKQRLTRRKAELKPRKGELDASIEELDKRKEELTPPKHELTKHPSQIPTAYKGMYTNLPANMVK